MSDYKIKLEDKAAFLNRLEKQNVAVDSFDIKDNKLKGYFEFTVDDPQANEIIKTILKQSPKINKLKEMKQSLTKGQLRQIIREELDAAGVSPKNEIALTTGLITLAVPVLIGVATAIAQRKDKAAALKAAEEAKGEKLTSDEVKAVNQMVAAAGAGAVKKVAAGDN
jgi:hypothetical protein